MFLKNNSVSNFNNSTKFYPNFISGGGIPSDPYGLPGLDRGSGLFSGRRDFPDPLSASAPGSSASSFHPPASHSMSPAAASQTLMAGKFGRAQFLVLFLF